MVPAAVCLSAALLNNRQRGGELCRWCANLIQLTRTIRTHPPLFLGVRPVVGRVS